MIEQKLDLVIQFDKLKDEFGDHNLFAIVRKIERKRTLTLFSV